MKLIVGLGNPGEKYKNTRHNAGFRAVDSFQKKIGFPDFIFSKKFNTEISEGTLDDEKVILAKPQTFMNNSSQSVKLFVSQYKLPPSSLFIIHDDIDLPLGKIKISVDRGTAGHKGVDSIIRNLKTKKFVRFRIGIQPNYGKPKNTEKFVLQKFNKTEEAIFKKVIKKTADTVEATIKEGAKKAMNGCN
ncbi:MAG: aminoacyl-tRNA hydrolase [Candidatus Paceibacterota bacterium]